MSLIYRLPVQLWDGSNVINGAHRRSEHFCRTQSSKLNIVGLLKLFYHYSGDFLYFWFNVLNALLKIQLRVMAWQSVLTNIILRYCSVRDLEAADHHATLLGFVDGTERWFLCIIDYLWCHFFVFTKVKVFLVVTSSTSSILVLRLRGCPDLICWIMLLRGICWFLIWILFFHVILMDLFQLYLQIIFEVFAFLLQLFELWVKLTCLWSLHPGFDARRSDLLSRFWAISTLIYCFQNGMLPTNFSFGLTDLTQCIYPICLIKISIEPDPELIGRLALTCTLWYL